MRTIKLGIVSLLLWFIYVNTALAIPYASQLDVASPINPTSFKYFLNHSADSAIIIIKDVATDSVAATFAGTANARENIVNWDGTDNNSGGAPVPPGTYKWEVRVFHSGFTTWTEYASNKTQENPNSAIYVTLPTGYPGRGVATDCNPANESYGLIYVCMSPTLAGGAGKGILRFNPDLSLYSDTTLILDSPTGVWDPNPVTANQVPWGIDVAEDGELWIGGQPVNADPGLELARGTWNGTTPIDVDVNHPGVGLPRGVEIQGTGSNRVLYWTEGNYINRVAIGNNLNMSGLTVETVVNVGIYSRHVRFDSAGNMYWLTRVVASAGTTYLYRWDANLVANGPFPLDTTSASWIVAITSVEGTRGNGLVVAQNNPSDPNDDEIYVLLMGTAAEKGIYKVGTSGTSSLNTTLTTESRIIIPPERATTSATSFDLTVDRVGNLIYNSGSTDEAIRAYSPPGPSDVVTPAPDSKQFTITGTQVEDNFWQLYE